MRLWLLTVFMSWAWCGGVRVFVLWRRPPASIAGRWWVNTALQDLTVALEMGALYGALGAPGLALAWAVLLLVMVLDAALLVRAGLRLQASYFRYFWHMQRLAPEALPPVVILLGATAVTSGVIATHPFFQRHPSPALAAASLAAAVGVALLANVGASAPHHACSNRLYSLQMSWLRRPLQPDAEHSLPTLLMSHHETARFHSNYPLWRTVERFTGEPLVSLRRLPDERPHVVMLFLESFAAREVGVLGGRHGVTPTFDALADQGVLWRNIQSAGTSTAMAALAALYGLPSRFSETSPQASQPPRAFGLPDAFAKAGYTTGYFHNGPISFEGAENFFSTHGFSCMVDAPLLRRVYGPLQEGRWGPADEYLLAFHADWLERQHAAGVATFSALFTMSGHHPWEVPQNFSGKPLDVPINTQRGRYLRTLQYTDTCLAMYLDKLRRSGLVEHTIFWILADTGQAYDGDRLIYGGHLTAQATRIPLLLWAPSRLQKAQVIDTAGTQLDILPTVLDLLDMVPAQHHAPGTSLARAHPPRSTFWVQAQAPQKIALHSGTLRYVHDLDHGGESIFDTAKDIDETVNLLAAYRHEASQWRRQTLHMRQFCTQIYKRDAFVPDGLHTVFAAVRVPRTPLGAPPKGYPETHEAVYDRLKALNAQMTLTAAQSGERAALQALCAVHMAPDDRLLGAQLEFKSANAELCGTLLHTEFLQRRRLYEIIARHRNP